MEAFRRQASSGHAIIVYPILWMPSE